MPIRCEIVSQDRIVFQGNVDIVVLPGSEGEMGILPHHTPLLTVLKYGIITVRKKSEEEHFTVAGGFAEVMPDQVTVLADAAENVEEIDFQRASDAKARAEDMLKQNLGKDADKYMAIQAALLRSNLRLDAARRFQRKKSDHNPG
jgi:F-type H+-transporting ATPase subunit epsilon